MKRVLIALAVISVMPGCSRTSSVISQPVKTSKRASPAVDETLGDLHGPPSYFQTLEIVRRMDAYCKLKQLGKPIPRSLLLPTTVSVALVVNGKPCYSRHELEGSLQATSGPKLP